METQPVQTKGNQSWIFIGRTDVEAETPTLWPPDAKSWFIWKDPDAGKDWRREEKGTTDGWMASPTQWAWVWVNSKSWWWTGRPGVLRSDHRVGHNWATELNKSHNLSAETTHLVSGCNETQVLSVSVQKEFSKRKSNWQETDLSIGCLEGYKLVGKRLCPRTKWENSFI